MPQEMQLLSLQSVVQTVIEKQQELIKLISKLFCMIHICLVCLYCDLTVHQINKISHVEMELIIISLV